MPLIESKKDDATMNISNTQTKVGNHPTEISSTEDYNFYVVNDDVYTPALNPLAKFGTITSPDGK